MVNEWLMKCPTVGSITHPAGWVSRSNSSAKLWFGVNAELQHKEAPALRGGTQQIARPFESGRGRYAHQSRLAKSSGAASRRRTIWKVFCGTRRPRLSATKGHAPEGACTCAGAFHAAFSVTPARIAVRGAAGIPEIPVSSASFYLAPSVTDAPHLQTKAPGEPLWKRLWWWPPRTTRK